MTGNLHRPRAYVAPRRRQPSTKATQARERMRLPEVRTVELLDNVLWHDEASRRRNLGAERIDLFIDDPGRNSALRQFVKAMSAPGWRRRLRAWMGGL